MEPRTGLDALIRDMRLSPILAAKGAQVLYLNPERVDSVLGFAVGGVPEIVDQLTHVTDAELKAAAKAGVSTPPVISLIMNLRASVSAAARRGEKHERVVGLRLDPQQRALLLETHWRRMGLLGTSVADLNREGAIALVKNEFRPFRPDDKGVGRALEQLLGHEAAEIMLQRLLAVHNPPDRPQFLLAAATPFPLAATLYLPVRSVESGGKVYGSSNIAYPSESDRYHLVRRLYKEGDVVFLEAYYVIEVLGGR